MLTQLHDDEAVGGLDSGCVAQLRVDTAAGARRGSGYRVADTLVLTAAHVVVDAESVLAVFNADLPDEWSAPASVHLCLPDGDVAVLTIDPPTGHSDVEPARFGRLGRRAAEVAFRALGFPRFKLRPSALDRHPSSAPYRDAYQAGGTIASLSNWREARWR